MAKKAVIMILIGLSSALLACGTVSFFRGRSGRAREACIQNLRAIDMAKARWATEETNTAARLHRE